MIAFWLLVAFFIKHLVIDFVCQSATMAKNKGTYGHWDGIRHAIYHMTTTTVLMAFCWGITTSFGGFPSIAFLAVIVGLLEGLIHYHMDWFKVFWCNRRGYKVHPDLGCSDSQAKWYWYWLGIDQTVHSLNYIFNVWIFILVLLVGVL